MKKVLWLTFSVVLLVSAPAQARWPLSGLGYDQGPLPANTVDTDVTNFDNTLSSADTDVQKALDTLDDLTLTESDADLLYLRLDAANDPMQANLDLGGFDLDDVGDIAVDTISSAAETSINVVLGSDAGDNFSIDGTGMVYTGDTNRLGIGTATPSAILTVQSTNSEADLGSEKVTNGDFTTDLTGWTNNGNWAQSGGTALHSAGATSTLEQDVTVAAGDVLSVTFTISGVTAGSLAMQIGGTVQDPTTDVSDNRTISFTVEATNTGNLIFTPTSDFDGAIDNVSVKLVTVTTDVILTNNDDGVAGASIKAGGSGLSNFIIGDTDNGRAITTGVDNVSIGSQAFRSLTTGARNLAIGTSALGELVSGSNNTAIGSNSSNLMLDGGSNVSIGRRSLALNIHGNSNVAIGVNSGRFSTGSDNVILGTAAGTNATGDSNIFIGRSAGLDETGDDTLIIDNQDRTSEALGRAGALLYGLFNATAADQILTTPGKFGVGLQDPDTKLEVFHAGTQLKLSFDADSFATFEVDTNDDLTVKPAAAGGVRLQPTTTDSTDFFQILDQDGGTPIFNIDSTNKRVGVGTAAPITTVHIVEDGATPTIQFERTGTYSGTDTAGNVSFRYAGDSLGGISIKRDGANDASAFAFNTQVAGGGVTEKMRIQGNGNVGIGVSDPDTLLEILNAGDQLKLSFDGTDNTTFGVDTSGDLTITPSGTQIIVPSKLDVQDELTLSKGTQNYTFSDRATALTIQSQTSGNGHFIELFTKDGDGTDGTSLSFYGVGSPSDVVNRERLRILIGTSGRYEIFTEADGTGTLKPLIIYTEGNTDQLYIATDGDIGIGTSAPDRKFQVTDDTDTVLGSFTTTRTGVQGGKIEMQHLSASPADADVPGEILFIGYNDAGTPAEITYSSIAGVSNDVSSGTEDGEIDFKTFVAGVETSVLRLKGGNVEMGTGTKSDGSVINNVAEVQTTDATVTSLATLTLLDENTYHARARVIGVESDGSNRASYEITVTAYRTGAGNATLQNTPTVLHAEESDNTWDVDFTVSGNDLRVSVTGVAATTIEWSGILEYFNGSN
jgi:hypothetical protein